MEVMLGDRAGHAEERGDTRLSLLLSGLPDVLSHLTNQDKEKDEGRGRGESEEGRQGEEGGITLRQTMKLSSQMS
eukprot:750214-Hanusia_phi.AAC.1